MAFLAPDFMQRYFSDAGVPLAGGSVYTYIAGTTTPQATYTDSTLGTPNANPVVLDSGGKASIWLGTGLAYKFAIYDASLNLLKTVDQIINDSPAIPFAVVNGGTGNNALVIAPTASTIPSWDANKNLSANNLFDSFTTTVTAAGTTTLVIGSTSIQAFTGTTTQTVVLPTTSVPAGGQYTVVNLSTGAVTVQSSGTNNIVTLSAGTQGLFTSLIGAPTTAANWTVTTGSTGGSPLQYYASAQVTTASNAIVSGTLTTFSNSPALSFTPIVSGKYRVYSNLSVNNQSSSYYGWYRIYNTTGSATLLNESQATYGQVTNGTCTVFAQSVYTLVSGVAYVFDLQGASSNGSNGVQTRGDIAPFYMFAEHCG